MEIDEQFWRYVAEQELFTMRDKLLVAVSGGRDSMLLLTLLYRQGIPVEVAHCNFHLRGDESDADEALVRAYTTRLGITLHVQHFDTKAYAEQHKVSIQMAARDLRYAWFEELRGKQNCSYIAVAHHKNDHVETVLVNLVRGTGLLGLQGILPKRDRLIRPLLFLDSKDVSNVVDQLQIPYRDDSSNFSNKYTRNKIRLDIIPEFEKLNPEFVDVMEDNIQRFQEAQHVLQLFVRNMRDEIFKNTGEEEWTIGKETLEDKDLALVYYLFEPFGFNKAVIKDFMGSLNKRSGLVFESGNWQLLLDRTVVYLRKAKGGHVEKLLFPTDELLAWGRYAFSVAVLDPVVIEKSPSVAMVDYDKLEFPLKIRSWCEGDSFQPLGMVGTKKISDFFIQKKVSLFEKNAIPILVNGNGEIIWVANFQIDDRYKITENTQKVLKLVCNIK